MRNLIIIVTVLLASTVSQAQTLREVSPKKVGMSAERLSLISELGQTYIDEGKLAGMVTLVAREGKVVHFNAQGYRSIADKTPLKKDALFRINSMTKPITAAALMTLYEKGMFQLNEPVSNYIPELKNLNVMTEEGTLVPAENNITIHQLMTHTAGFSYDFNDDDPVDQLYKKVRPHQSKSSDEFIAKLVTLPLKHQPGTQFRYSVAIEVMGVLVERLSGESLDVYLNKTIFQPLGMKDTFFTVPENKLSRFLPNHIWNKEENRMTVSRQSRYYDHTGTGPKFFAGGGGLVSTAADYLRFAEMMRRGGSFDGVRILGPKTVQFMTKDHLPGLNIPSPYGNSGFGFGIGSFYVETDNTASALLNSEGSYSWGGGSGTVFWIDPVEEVVVIAMIQLRSSPLPLGSQLRVLTNQAIVELK